MTERYIDEPYVIGNDLRNEVRLDAWNIIMPRWGNGDERSDWKMMAEKVGNAILDVNPNHLIIVESVQSGAEFNTIKNDPLVLKVPNRLIYSAHYYDNFWSERVSPWHRDYASFKQAMDRHVGFMTIEGEEYTAPIWLGEFGTG